MILWVLEKNPPKQGLKQQKVRRPARRWKVLEKNPPKQGLKPGWLWQQGKMLYRFREKSTKTRIETENAVWLPAVNIIVLEKNPPKQGLKLTWRELGWLRPSCFREKSTKTRIETQIKGLKCSMKI